MNTPVRWEDWKKRIEEHRPPENERGLVPGKLYNVGIYTDSSAWQVCRFIAEFIGMHETFDKTYLFKGREGSIQVSLVGTMDITFKEVANPTY